MKFNPPFLILGLNFISSKRSRQIIDLVLLDKEGSKDGQFRGDNK
uniref:Uncharacterized protein n=1 Tax=Picea glauca TaxID=3330 RepID=A0A117NHU7_PICGL|nr:hypothetical protein ABT39_MTgene4299 [Picea glauca]